MEESENALSFMASLDLAHFGHYPNVHKRLQVARLILEAIAPMNTTFDLMISSALQAINEAERMLTK
jgi:hypothetical protein